MQKASSVTLCAGCQSAKAASSDPMKNLPPGTSTMSPGRSVGRPAAAPEPLAGGGTKLDGGAARPAAADGLARFTARYAKPPTTRVAKTRIVVRAAPHGRREDARLPIVMTAGP